MPRCTVNKKKKKNRNISIYFNASYSRDIKLLSIIMDYCLLQFDDLKIFLRVLLHGGSLPNCNFFNAKPQVFQWSRKVHLLNCQVYPIKISHFSKSIWDIKLQKIAENTLLIDNKFINYTIDYFYFLFTCCYPCQSKYYFL